MTNWNLEENVTNIDQSKRLADAGVDLGEVDGYWDIERQILIAPIVTKYLPEDDDDLYQLVRRLVCDLTELETNQLFYKPFLSRGKEAIKACVDLLILLRKEKINEKEDSNNNEFDSK